ncbi:MAG: hypothetical protein OXC44_05095, partial [Proteobacteria bacterium]|nr:hypothetical protein [Pseudomonadota bacterium]
LNNNCADKVLTGDFADDVSQIDANDHVKPKYKYVTIERDSDEEPYLPDEDTNHIDYHVQLAWPEIKDKVKVYEGLVGTKSDDEIKPIVPFHAGKNSLTRYLGYSQKYGDEFSDSTTRNISRTPYLVAIRELQIGCEDKAAYKKKSINANNEYVDDDFFGHNNFEYNNTDNDNSCNTGIRVVTRALKPVEDDAGGAGGGSDDAFEPDGCRVITGINYQYKKGSQRKEPIHIADGDSKIKAGTLKDGANYQTHDAITCYTKATQEECAANSFNVANGFNSNLHYDEEDSFKNSNPEENTLWASSYQELAFIDDGEADGIVDHDDVQAQKRDLYRLRHIKERLLYKDRRNAPVPDSGDFNGTLEPSPRPYSVYFPNESNSFVTVGGLVMDIDLHEEAPTTTPNSPIPCPGVSNTWHSLATGAPPDSPPDSLLANLGCSNKSDSKKPDTQYYWDYPNSKVVSGSVCVYFMFINVKESAARAENERAIKDVFDLTTSSSLGGTPCLYNSSARNYNDEDDFCKKERASLPNKELRKRYDFFCDAPPESSSAS